MDRRPSRRKRCMGTIHEFASPALYLASDAAAYLVGQTLTRNGGVAN